MKISEAINQKKFKSNMEMVIINILYTNNWLSDHHKGFFDNYGIKSQHYNVLRILKGCYPEASSPGEIKSVMVDKSPDLTRLIDKLVKMDLVERNECSENRRKVNVKISDNGIALLKKIAIEMKDLDKNWKNNLSDEEAQKLSDLLDKFRG